MFERLLHEERAQGAIEYILLAGGIIVSAVVIFAIYSSMTKSAALSLNATTANATAAIANKTTDALATM